MLPFQKMAAETVSLAGILSGDTNTTKDVFAIGHSFHVFRVQTDSVPAEVINGESCWNRPLCQFVRQAMR